MLDEKRFQEQLETVFKSFHDKYESLDSRMKAEAFKSRVMRVFQAWEDWALYPTEFLIKLQNTFFGLATDSKVG
jgi:U2-associated protein SR140